MPSPAPAPAAPAPPAALPSSGEVWQIIPLPQSSLVFARDAGGNEQGQLYRLAPGASEPVKTWTLNVLPLAAALAALAAVVVAYVALVAR